MTTVRGLTQAIYYFYRQLGATNLKVEKGKYFCYGYNDIFDEHIIEYSLNPESKDCLLGYQDYFKKYHPEFEQYPCNFFTFSLLHELGHYFTLPYARPASIANSRKAIKNLCAKNMAPRKKQARYCELYVEKIANEKAIELIENNYEIIQKFEKRFAKLIA